MKKLANPILWEKIERLDLRAIIYKLTHPSEEYGWSKELAETVTDAYRKYLYLAGTYGKTVPVVPSKIIDEFWHMHILDTNKYATDCQNLFGTILHHYPYLGIRFEGDRKNLNNAFEKTLEIWQDSFGEEMSKILFPKSKKVSASKAADCDASCEAACTVSQNINKLTSQAENCSTCGPASCANPSCGSNECTGYAVEQVPEYLRIG